MRNIFHVFLDFPPAAEKENLYYLDPLKSPKKSPQKARTARGLLLLINL